MTQPMEAQSGFALAGFKQPIFDATRVFRTTLNALSRPGRMYDMQDLSACPRSLNPTIAAVLLALADIETPVWLSGEMDTQEAREFLTFHTGCPIVEKPSLCSFAVMNEKTDMTVFNELPVGNAEYPDRSATILMAVRDMSEGSGVSFRGPGIEDTHTLIIEGLPVGFWTWSETNRTYFPCGIDVIFASQNKIAGLARTTQVEV